MRLSVDFNEISNANPLPLAMRFQLWLEIYSIHMVKFTQNIVHLSQCVTKVLLFEIGSYTFSHCSIENLVRQNSVCIKFAHN